MKIQNVTIDVLELPVDRAYVVAGQKVEANWHVFARIRTRDGVEGFGYVVKLGKPLVHPLASAARELGECLIGLNVLDTEAAWHRMTSMGRWVGPGGLLHWAIAPLDIAMWDAAGRTLGQPLYRLLGGFRNQRPAYASDHLWYSLSLDELARSASNHAAKGFRAMKLRLGRDASPAEQAERVQVARQAAGAGVEIMVDGTESWNLPYARVAGRALQDAGATWLEDPLHHEDVAGLASLAAELDIPVTGGENLYTLSQFRNTLEARAVDVAILDLFRVGGITPWCKIAALAQAHRVQISGHVVPEVHLHLLASAPNGHVVEYMPRSVGILQDLPEPVDGMLTAWERPGHGLSLDLKAFEKFRVG